jgi:DNA-binding NtrC family response regulator
VSAGEARSRRLGWAALAATDPGSARVLVIDDERDVREGLKKLVLRFGHEVKVAASAEEGDAWLGSERFDVLLLDMELPRMKGPEFLKWALERDPELAVIILTGLDDPELALQCMEAGARTYLVKPVEADFLRLALRDALAMRAILIERNDSKERSSSV